MTYTVKQLAKLSGVSIRTLHFYDEIGLLKPAYYGENSYRYYEEAQLLKLQQILFYRELDLPLNDIQGIMGCDSFDNIEALISHQHILKNKLEQTKILLETINKTIAHLRGKINMKNEELYYGFNSEKQKGYEKYLIEENIVSESLMKKSKEKIKHWTAKDKDEFLQEGEAINIALVDTLNKNLKPSSTEVQQLIHRHYAWIQRSWTPDRESYLGLSELYKTPEFKKFFDHHDPKLLEFLIEAMKVFAENQWS